VLARSARQRCGDREVVQYRFDRDPFGQFERLGCANGKHGFDSLTHAKSILLSPTDVAIDHLYPPYTIEKVQALSQWLGY
jgi:aldehyde dehydrogenase (NAD+)